MGGINGMTELIASIMVPQLGVEGAAEKRRNEQRREGEKRKMSEICILPRGLPL